MFKTLNFFFALCAALRNKTLSIVGTFFFRVDLNVSGNYKIGKAFSSNGIVFLRLKKSSSIQIGDNLNLNNGEVFNSIGRQSRCVFTVRSNAELIIGDNVGMSSTAIFCNRRVVIGDRVKLGGNVCIYDTDFHSLDFMARQVRRHDVAGTRSSAVRIGNDVFVGAHSTILKGVTIGDRSIIGACSVVTKDVPPDQIWGGNPAKCIRQSLTEQIQKYS
ncbi:MAG TPA: acyltransferase [Chitinophagaceae bacterium]|nr:acyltransferase [Chitinophagaceae bacterium]